MEAQDNKQLALRKAISAHEAAEAAIGDLMEGGHDPRYEEMLERIRTNCNALRLDSETSDPAAVVG